MGSFAESQLGVGGAVNDTSPERGGSLGIALLGSLLGTSHFSHLANATSGSGLPASALETALGSVGAGYQVAAAIAGRAQQFAAQAPQTDDDAQLKAQAGRLAQGACGHPTEFANPCPAQSSGSDFACRLHTTDHEKALVEAYQQGLGETTRRGRERSSRPVDPLKENRVAVPA
ncbi:hypothetical protein [Streptomyces rishiriensis]|uniref:hypothetical protein n=1 Tax=Streptomyces rishiriensis TaxID=68264 RepID=UPI0037CE58F6